MALPDIVPDGISLGNYAWLSQTRLDDSLA